jgi:hypothetical protein
MTHHAVPILHKRCSHREGQAELVVMASEVDARDRNYVWEREDIM